MYLLVKPNGKETPDKRGNVKMIYTDQITKIPGQTHLSSYVHYLTKNNAIYPDIPPRASSLYAGTHVLIVLPKNRYLEGNIAFSTNSLLMRLKARRHPRSFAIVVLFCKQFKINDSEFLYYTFLEARGQQRKSRVLCHAHDSNNVIY